MEIIALLQTDRELGAALDRIADEWWPGALIHGDVRFENVLAIGSQPGFDANVCLVDWETATFGDPCWDLGCLIAEFVHRSLSRCR